MKVKEAQSKIDSDPAITKYLGDVELAHSRDVRTSLRASHTPLRTVYAVGI